MKFSGMRSLGATGERRTAIVAAFLLSLALDGESFAALKHNYLFNSGNGIQIIDSVGGANGSVLNIDDDPVTGVVPADSRFELGQNRYGNLPGAAIAINTYSQLTIESWIAVSQVHEGQYTASMAFGNTVAGVGQNYVMMQPTRAGAAGGSGNFRVPMDGAEIIIAGPNDLSDGRIHHTVMTIDMAADQMAYYVDGVQIGTAALAGRSLADVSTNFAYLGRSVWSGDPRLQGAIYEFRIYDDAKNSSDVANLFAAGCQAGCGNLYMEIDRNTGAAVLHNGLSTKNMIIYGISSPKGALNGNNWLSLTNNYDQNSGGSLDPNDEWMITSQTKTLLSEEDFLGQGAEDGAAIVKGAAIQLGNIWTKSPFEDLQFSMTILDSNFLEQTFSVPVFFINGINNAQFSRSDFNTDGVINEADYLTLTQNHLKALNGTLHIDTFAFGDINGDLVNDYRDFRLFKADYIAANGAGAFANLIATYGTVPEPGTYGLVLLGAAGVLGTRRKRIHPSRLASDMATSTALAATCTMNQVAKTLSLVAALLLMCPAVSNAQVVVGSQNFDALPPGILTDSGLPGARFFVCCGATPGSEFANVISPGAGGSGNAVQAGAQQNSGGFTLGGFGFDMPISGNISPNRSDYRLEFDMRLVSGQPFNPLEFFITMVDTPVFGGNQAHGSVFSVPGLNNLTLGGDFQHFSLNLANPTGLFFNRPIHWLPVDPNGNNSISFEFNVQGVPAESVTQVFEIDNVQLILDIATSLALVVDPANGRARIRNVSDAPVTFDYYRVQSTNGSLLTSNFNGTTGWNSLSDQGVDAIGAGLGESWDEVTEASSASRLVEQFLLGDTTLAPGQSVSLGAPVNPAILNNQLNSLLFRFGGPSYEGEGLGQVIFENLSALIGDYNQNGVVDAADYTIWRNRVGQPANSLPNRDPNNGGNIGPDDYASWKANFGAQLGVGSGGQNVPEPAAVVLCLVAIGLIAGARPRRTT